MDSSTTISVGLCIITLAGAILAVGGETFRKDGPPAGPFFSPWHRFKDWQTRVTPRGCWALLIAVTATGLSVGKEVSGYYAAKEKDLQAKEREDKATAQHGKDERQIESMRREITKLSSDNAELKAMQIQSNQGIVSLQTNQRKAEAELTKITVKVDRGSAVGREELLKVRDLLLLPHGGPDHGIGSLTYQIYRHVLDLEKSLGHAGDTTLFAHVTNEKTNLGREMAKQVVDDNEKVKRELVKLIADVCEGKHHPDTAGGGGGGGTGTAGAPLATNSEPKL
jgi:hypothetical protein